MTAGHNAEALQDLSRRQREAYGSVTPGVWPVGGGNGITMTPVSVILDNPGTLPDTQPTAEHDEPLTPGPTGGRTRAARRNTPPE